jgi:stress response protein YsnF
VRLEKQPVLREEVNVGKREVQDVTRVSGDVQHEELRVDPDPEAPKRSATGEELPDDLRRHG